MKVISLPVQLSNYSLANLVVSIILNARCPSDSVVRVSDCYSKGLWFESLLDPQLSFMDLFLTLILTSIIYGSNSMHIPVANKHWLY